MSSTAKIWTLLSERGGRMKSREDETYVALNELWRCGNLKERELYEIAMSLGRIADMLAEMNRYIVDYDESGRQKEDE
jgi:hypothetical protein